MEVAAAGPSFGEANFGAAELGDRRRTRRLVRAVDTMARQPAGTRPDKFDAPAGLKGLYRLLGDPAVTPASVFAPARARTLQRMAAAAGPVLVLHDWTELDSTGRRSLHDALGPIGNGSRRGYLCANALAVAARTRAVLGLVCQELAVRPTVAGPEARARRRGRADRETRLWRAASRQVPAAAAGRLQVEVADRGADVLEFLDFVTAAGKSYLVRPEHNRRVERADGARAKLHDDARSLPRMGERRVSVGATAGRPKRDARGGVGWGPVTLLVPKQPRGQTRRVPLTAWVVSVREIDPPAGVGPPEWVLLTNVPVATAADARGRIDWYEVRWVIEEYHKALKTGCGVEALQFTAVQRLQPAIAVLSVVAVALLGLRDASRTAGAATRPARAPFAVAWVRVLSLWRYREVRPELSVAEFFLALARLGGQQSRKHDHPPGWLVLWRGWTKLQTTMEAASLLGVG